MKLYIAIALYQKRQLSLGKSAQFVSMDKEKRSGDNDNSLSHQTKA